MHINTLPTLTLTLTLTLPLFNSYLKFSRSSLIADISTSFDCSVVVFFQATGVLALKNTVVEMSAINELLLKFGLELKKLLNEFYQPTERISEQLLHTLIPVYFAAALMCEWTWRASSLVGASTSAASLPQ